MGRFNGLDTKGADGECLTGIEMVARGNPAEVTVLFRVTHRWARDVYRQSEFAIKNSDSVNMINVVMGDDQAVYISDINVMHRQSLFGLLAADPRVEKKLGIIGFNVDTVSIRAGLE